MKRGLFLAVVAVLVSLGARAAEPLRVIVIGTHDKPTPVPFGLSGRELVYQQVYPAKLFPDAVEIREIAFASAPGYSKVGRSFNELRIGMATTVQGPMTLNLERAWDKGTNYKLVFHAPGLMSLQSQVGLDPEFAWDGSKLVRPLWPLREPTSDLGPQVKVSVEKKPNLADKALARSNPPWPPRQAKGEGFDLVFPIQPYIYNPDKGNLLVEISIEASMGRDPIMLDAGKSPDTGSAHRIPDSTVGITHDNEGLFTRFVVRAVEQERRAKQVVRPGAEKKKGEASDQPTK